MRFPTHLKGVASAALAVALGTCLFGCSSDGGSGSTAGLGDTSQGTAATVNGKTLGEKAVTDYIADFRSSSSLDSDEAWGEWMVSNNYTPEAVRDEVIDYYVNQMLMDQAAQELNVTVTDEDITAALDEVKSMFESDEAYQEALTASNLTEESYIETVLKPNLLQEKVAEAVTNEGGEEGEGGEGGGANDDVITFVNENTDMLNGAKRSSHILFSLEDQELAQQVLDQLKAGEITFEEAVAQYSTDTGSAQQGGDVGYDALTTFVEPYQTALDALNEGEMSDLVQSDYGYHIIMCTDVFEVPEGGVTSIDQVPVDMANYIESMNDTDTSESFTTWFEDYRSKATIDIKPMPEGLPYDIDITPYQEAAQNGSAATEGTDEAAAEAGAEGAAPVEGEATADEAAAAQAEAENAAAAEATAAGNPPATEATAAESSSAAATN